MSSDGNLNGRVIVWTGSAESGRKILSCFEKLGATAARLPLIICEKSVNLGSLSGFNPSPDSWLIFSSARAAEAIRGLPFSAARIAAVGPSTAETLESMGRRVDLIPTVQTADGLADAIIRASDTPGVAVFIRGNNALPTIPTRLRAAGFTVQEREVYRTLPVSVKAAAQIAVEIQASADAVLFGSPAGVNALNAAVALDEIAEKRPDLIWVALGSTTGTALAVAGIANPVTANSPAPDDVVRAVQAAF